MSNFNSETFNFLKEYFEGSENSYDKEVLDCKLVNSTLKFSWRYRTPGMEHNTYFQEYEFLDYVTWLFNKSRYNR